VNTVNSQGRRARPTAHRRVGPADEAEAEAETEAEAEAKDRRVDRRIV
jgi:hypothetical protein